MSACHMTWNDVTWCRITWHDMRRHDATCRLCVVLVRQCHKLFLVSYLVRYINLREFQIIHLVGFFFPWKSCEKWIKGEEKSNSKLCFISCKYILFIYKFVCTYAEKLKERWDYMVVFKSYSFYWYYTIFGPKTSFHILLHLFYRGYFAFYIWVYNYDTIPLITGYITIPFISGYITIPCISRYKTIPCIMYIQVYYYPTYIHVFYCSSYNRVWWIKNWETKGNEW